MAKKDKDIFTDENGKPKILHGVTIYSGSTTLAEMAGRIGFDAVWFEMEHGPACFERIESLCYAAESAEAIPVVRVSDSQRTHILRALETGARIIIVPMVNTAEQAQKIVEYGKFPPIGSRGYNTRSRGVGFGINDTKTAFKQANARTHLFVQIETSQAVDNLNDILSVEGISGIFVGPGDLSASLGCIGDLNNTRIVEVATNCISRAREAGKHAGVLVSPGPLLDAAIEAGSDLVFVGGDIANLSVTWTQLLKSFR